MTVTRLLAAQKRTTRPLRLMVPRTGHQDLRNEGDGPRTVPVCPSPVTLSMLIRP